MEDKDRPQQVGAGCIFTGAPKLSIKKNKSSKAFNDHIKSKSKYNPAGNIIN